MSFLRSLTPSNPAPLDYVTPPFPSLYWPLPTSGAQSNYLYHTTDIWRFTVVWTLLFYGAVHIGASGYAVIIQRRNWKVIWVAPLAFIVIGGLEAFIAGSVVGGLLSGVYNAGYFKMSTWVPFVWALISTLAVILSSFAIQGGL